MTDKELRELLKRAEPPARDEVYWESFPARMRYRLTERTQEKKVLHEPKRTFVVWKVGFAAMATAIALFLVLNFTRSEGGRNKDLRLLRDCYRETAGLFSRQVKALRIESGTLHLDLSDRPDIPDSMPLFVRACKNSKCGAAITFSGQQIELLGEKLEVLADGHGGIILLTQNGVVTSGNSRDTKLGHLEVGWLDERL